jgi:branched-chain amino acid transport system permease protein
MDILPQLIANSLIAGSIYALVALGFNLIFGAMRFFDLGYGALTAVGAYATFFAASTMGLATSISILAGILAAGIIGYGIERAVYRPLRNKKASNMVLLVASLGVFTVLQALIAIFFTSQFRTLPNTLIPRGTVEIAGAIVTYVQLSIFFIAILTTAFLYCVLRYTMFGKAIRAIRDDTEVANIVGIPTQHIIGAVFFIGSASAGLAGIMVGFDVGIEPTMGLALLLKGVIAAIIGGAGNVFGGILGALLLGFAENFGIWYIPGEWKDAIAFTILILFLLFKPHGLSSK